MNLSREQWLELAVDRGAPRVTLTMPLEHEALTNDKNRIRWKNLVNEAERQLGELGVGAEERRRLLQPARQLVEEEVLGEDGARGLAMLLSTDRNVTHWCPHPLRADVRVADRFDLSPLLDHVLPGHRFWVLALSANGLRLLRCSPHDVEHVPLPSAPEDLDEANWAFNEPVPRGPLHTNRYAKSPIGGSAPFMGGQGFGHEDRWSILFDTYLRAVAQAMHDDVGALDGPLVLACTERLHGLWRELFGEAACHPVPVHGNPEHETPEALRDAAWRLVAPELQPDEEAHRQRFFAAAKDGRAVGALDEVVQAAVDQRIDTLFLRRDAPLYGTIDGDGGVHPQDPHRAGSIDVTAQLVALTLAAGGRVIEVDALPDPTDDRRVNAVLRW